MVKDKVGDISSRLVRVAKLISAYYPNEYNELYGIAKSTNHSIIDILLLDEESCRNTYEKCTTFAGNTQFGEFLAHNEDWDLGFDKYIYIAKIVPKNGVEFLTMSYVGLPGSSVVVNRFGISFSGNALFNKPPIMGIPKSVMLRNLCESVSISDFQNRSIKCKLLSVSNHSVVIDKSGGVVSIEMLVDGHDIKLQIHDKKLPFAHTNHFLYHGNVDDISLSRIKNSKERLTFINKMLNQSLTHRKIKNILKYHGNDNLICRHGEVQTIASAIVYPQDRSMFACVGNPCVNEYQNFEL